MSSEAVTVHIFRHAAFAPAGDTLVTVAPVACATIAYGAAGLADAFGGSALFENRNSGEKWVGVWGARNGARFRRRLRQFFTLSVEKSAPDARLALYTTRRGNRPDYRAWATDHARQTTG
ncbi:hypothetical protein [Rhizobium sp.]